ncbi:MAG: hypothetical protein IT193_15930 [Propionibacteriaceae bacterium]|nr:hypothetical protein [Propionibacteriaceae bacterium]
MTYRVEKRGKNKPWTQDDTEAMFRRHEEKIVPAGIAAALGFTESTVRNKMYEHGLKPHVKNYGKSGAHPKEPSPPKGRPRPFAIATETWGEAFDHERMRLHGVPIKFLDLMRQTNERRKALGLEQWTGDEACVIP